MSLIIMLILIVVGNFGLTVSSGMLWLRQFTDRSCKNTTSLGQTDYFFPELSAFFMFGFAFFAPIPAQT